MIVINIAAALKSYQQHCESQLEAELLLAFVLQVSREYLHTWPLQNLTSQQIQSFEEYVNRRSKGEPLAYILGVKEFWSLPLKVNRDVLTPRPETEELVQQVLDLTAAMTEVNEPKVLDLGTGSGAIALAIAKERPHFQITAVDKSKAALLIAIENAKNLSLSNVEFLESDWFSVFSKKNLETADYKFDVIVANPPYIAASDNHLKDKALAYEPQEALVSKSNGFYDLKKIIKEAPQYLVTNGWLILEHGFEQGQEVKTSMLKCGYTDVQICQDLAGLDRICRGRSPMALK